MSYYVYYNRVENEFEIMSSVEQILFLQTEQGKLLLSGMLDIFDYIYLGEL